MSKIGARIKQELKRNVFSHDPDWSCSGRDARAGAHGLIQYPAMMVPAMQRDILTTIRDVDPAIKRVLDPFVGAGTALTESLSLGCEFLGYDINPLAVLVSRVKAGPFDVDLLRAAAERVLRHIGADSARHFAVHFDRQKKWFRKSNSITLSKIRRAIEKEDNRHVRRFLWVCVAETIRRCSNSRTSTYKLHIRPDEEIEKLDGAALLVFPQVLKKNLDLMASEKQRLGAAKLLNGVNVRRGAKIELKDIGADETPKAVARDIDLVITSPPYGDNKTTVPYGQFSYLALQWIPLSDIDESLTLDVLEATSTIDSHSLGGSLRDLKVSAEQLRDLSPAFSKTLDRLSKIDDEQNATKRWTSFCRDLRKAVGSISSHIRPGGFSVWTIGERNMRGYSVPLSQVLEDLHAERTLSSVGQYNRKIYTKRMPMKNSLGDLMQSEQVCMFQAPV